VPHDLAREEVKSTDGVSGHFLNWKEMQGLFKSINLWMIALFALVASSFCRAADLVEIYPVTNKILMLHFKDGTVQYHGYHQKDQDDSVIQSKLNLANAVNPASYQVQSGDDGSYASGVNPTSVGRKSKGMGFSRNCKWDGQRCNNDYVLEHWIYLQLPQALQRGKTYKIKTGSLAANVHESTVTYDEKTLRSVALHINQLGYLPRARQKYGYISHWMGDLGPLSLEEYSNGQFQLIRTDTGETVFSGPISKQKDLRTGGPDTGQTAETPNGNFVGADVWQCDFSQFQTPGEYRLVVDGIGSSYPFQVGNDVYRQAFYTTTRGLYHQRSGIDLVEPYTHWPRKADHRIGVVPGYTLKYSSYRIMDANSENGNESDVKAKIIDSVDTTNMWGWYHDAGDWDGYPSHAEVPAHLLTVYELAPANFRDGELNIPESGNGIPDVLDEAVWLPSFYRRAKGPTGGVAGGRIHGDFNQVDLTGVPSYEDTSTWIAYGEEPVMTFKYAALAAHLAYCFQMAQQRGQLTNQANGSELITSWREESLRAYQWAQEHTLTGDQVSDSKAYAAAWIYKLTGETSYQTVFANNITITSGNIGNFGNVKWAIWAYITTPDTTPGLDKIRKSDLIQAARNYAQQEVLDPIEKNRSFRMGGNWMMPLIVGQPTTPLVMPAILAYETTREEKYLNAVQLTCDYMLGGNPLDMVWVTGLGKQFPNQVLHLDSWYGQKNQMVPGIVPYGPIHACDWMSGPNGSCDWVGPWDADFSRTTAYPSHDRWPAHELYFENRYCPPTNEFTVSQNIGPAAAAYGYLSAPNSVRAGATRVPDHSPRTRD
jgi:endoglucanase